MAVVSSERRKDSQWVKGMFGLSPFARDRRNLSIRQSTNADFKFADTTVGGNSAINPPPQFTQFADLPTGGLLANVQLRGKSAFWENDNDAGSAQMGRVYGETHEDYGHEVYMRFCLPKYTGSIAFFTNMYDRNMSVLANEGLFNKIMRGAGTIGALAIMFTVIPLHVFVPIIICSRTLAFILGQKPSQYYYLKEAMPQYLLAVQNILDTMLLHYRLVPMWDVIGTDRYTTADEAGNTLNSAIAEAHSQLPTIWKSNGKFDVFKMVSRYQMLANYQAETLSKIYAGSTEKNFAANLRAYLQEASTTMELQNAVSDTEMSLYDLAMKYQNNPMYQVDEATEAEQEARYQQIKAKLESDTGQSGEAVIDEQDAYQSQLNSESDGSEESGEVPDESQKTFGDLFGNLGIGDQVASQLKDGGMWIGFRVDNKETVSDSFSNSTKEPEIASALNGITATARTIDFSLSGGNTGFDAIDTVVGGVKSLIGGALDALSLVGLASIYGKSFADIPDMYDSSSADVGTLTYNIKLRTPYGNDFSCFQDLIVPLAFILAGVLPMATGRQSHTNPFYVEAYARGRQTIRTGMITSVSITRGAGNVGWRPDGKPLGIDVAITIKDLSKIVAMPVIKDPGIFDPHNKYTDYLATLGGMSLHEATYNLDKLVLNINLFKQSWKSAFMSGRITSSAMDNAFANAVRGLTAGTVLK